MTTNTFKIHGDAATLRKIRSVVSKKECLYLSIFILENSNEVVLQKQRARYSGLKIESTCISGEKKTILRWIDRKISKYGADVSVRDFFDAQQFFKLPEDQADQDIESQQETNPADANQNTAESDGADPNESQSSGENEDQENSAGVGTPETSESDNQNSPKNGLTSTPSTDQPTADPGGDSTAEEETRGQAATLCLEQEAHQVEINPLGADQLGESQANPSTPEAEQSDLQEMDFSDLHQAQQSLLAGDGFLPSRKQRNRPGGATVQIGDVTEAAIGDVRTGQRIAKALTRIIQSYQAGAIGEKSPRIKGSKLIKELVSQRYNLSRPRREEQETKPVLIMCDVSGSCSATSDETLLAAVQIHQAMPNLVQVVVHSNGYPCEILGRFLKSMPGHPSTFQSWYTQHDWGLVVNFGDWDAGEILGAISHQAEKLLWLDSYCASAIGHAFPSTDFNETPDGFNPGVVQKIDGVGDGQSTLQALRLVK